MYCSRSCLWVGIFIYFSLSVCLSFPLPLHMYPCINTTVKINLCLAIYTTRSQFVCDYEMLLIRGIITSVMTSLFAERNKNKVQISKAYCCNATSVCMFFLSLSLFNVVTKKVFPHTCKNLYHCPCFIFYVGACSCTK